jgi:hypothetical protein
MQSQRQQQRSTEKMDHQLEFIIDLLLKRNHDEAKNQQKRRSRPMRRDTYSTISTGDLPSSNNSLMKMETSGNSGMIPRVVCFPTNEATAPRELPLFQ